ncbi:hypothetical protein EVAR_91447_1 [Eumeta japonica]|uniref:Uncharacterized protein n=1 Tax=Eumeta variegata TaxID=151549 RepID=A0A4C1X3H8_EUMVA|nr:hypothetical protein EVAR_91447_1 [Eumeta japonica]
MRNSGERARLMTTRQGAGGGSIAPAVRVVLTAERDFCRYVIRLVSIRGVFPSSEISNESVSADISLFPLLITAGPAGGPPKCAGFRRRRDSVYKKALSFDKRRTPSAYRTASRRSNAAGAARARRGRAGRRCGRGNKRVPAPAVRRRRRAIRVPIYKLKRCAPSGYFPVTSGRPARLANESRRMHDARRDYGARATLPGAPVFVAGAVSEHEPNLHFLPVMDGCCVAHKKHQPDENARDHYLCINLSRLRKRSRGRDARPPRPPPPRPRSHDALFIAAVIRSVFERSVKVYECSELAADFTSTLDPGGAGRAAAAALPPRRGPALYISPQTANRISRGSGLPFFFRLNSAYTVRRACVVDANRKSNKRGQFVNWTTETQTAVAARPPGDGGREQDRRRPSLEDGASIARGRRTLSLGRATFAWWLKLRLVTGACSFIQTSPVREV